MLNIHEWSSLDDAARVALMRRPALTGDSELTATVSGILARVRADGDQALRAITAEIDAIALGELAVAAAEFDAAETSLSSEQRAAIELAATNIDRFHRAQLPAAISVETAPGVRCERVTRPLQSVGLYVPAGSAPLPSTALMLGVPSAIAGCPVRVLCSPPRADGSVDPAVLYAARVCGISQVFRLGGAQAIAAMAFGTESVPKVDKLFGPGNKWVTAAKALVSAAADGAAQDLPAGPSEVMVIADATAAPHFVAADLLSQAEHGSDSQVVLVTESREFAAAVTAAVEMQLTRLTREPTARAALHHSYCVLVEDIATAVAVANQYAPEHLIIQTEDPRRMLPAISAAGSVFLGPWAPETIGDYCSGTNHVLPTYGYARNYSSLGLTDFMRSMTVQELSPAGLSAIGPAAITLARLEGLDAHANAVSLRLETLATDTLEVSPE